MKFKKGDTVKVEAEAVITTVHQNIKGEVTYGTNIGGMFKEDCLTLVKPAVCEHEYKCAKCGELLEIIKPVEQPKHEYKIGDKVKVIGNCKIRHFLNIGDIGEIVGFSSKGNPDIKTSSITNFVHITEIEPCTEPKKEAVKLYCVKDAWGICAKGKIYELKNGSIQWDGFYENNNYADFADYSRRNPNISKCLFPLVKRPAKVGEWVLPLYAHGVHCPEVNKNEPQKVEEICSLKSISTTYENAFTHDEYLVLDGYQPEEEKCKCCGQVIRKDND